MTEMRLSTRWAKIADSASVTELSGQLGYPQDIAATTNRIELILKNSDHCFFVAVDHEKVVGWVHGFYAIRVESDFFVEIGGLVVHDGYRRNGIGNMLVKCLVDWAALRNCKKVRVRCNSLRTDSHKFYEKAGFRQIKEQKIFEIDLKSII